MVFCVVNPAVIGVDDAFRTPATLANGIYVAFVVFAVGKDLFPVAKHIAPYGTARRYLLYRAASPAKIPGFALGDVIIRQAAVGV